MDLKAQLIDKKTKLRTVEGKAIEAIHLLILFNDYTGRPKDIVTKARLFDKVILKLGPLIEAKVIDMVVDYTVLMDKLLVKMRVLINGLNLVLVLQPTPLKAISNIFEFSEISTAEIL